VLLYQALKTVGWKNINMKKKKILCVISTLDTGGAQRVLSNLTMNLSDEYDVDILLNDKESVKFPYRGKLITLGLPSKEDKENLLYQIKVFVKRMKYLRKLKNTGEYVACLSFLDSANIANVISGHAGNTKVITSIHNYMSNAVKKSIKYRIIVAPLLKLNNLSDKTVAVSKAIADDLMNNYGIKKEKIRVIYNGINTEYIQNMVQNFEKYKRFTYITMGRMVSQKGQWHLIKAFAKLNAKYNNIHLVILGDGIYKDQLSYIIDKLKLKNCVTIEGFKENPFNYLASSDVFVFPSIYEGFSNAIVEAMACGLPIISTDHKSGAREILAPKTNYREMIGQGVEKAEFGILTPVGSEKFDLDQILNEELEPSEKYLYEAMKLLYIDEKLRNHYTKQSLIRAEQLSAKEMAKEWEKLIG
jgi:glycosyltransferase involved in cell wall biosynthesis